MIGVPFCWKPRGSGGDKDAASQEAFRLLGVEGPRAVYFIIDHAGWCPPVISWFINPINYSYKYHKP